MFIMDLTLKTKTINNIYHQYQQVGTGSNVTMSLENQLVMMTHQHWVQDTQ